MQRMVEQPDQGRSTIQHGEDGELRISIPAKKHWFLLIFVGAWLGGWFFGEQAAIRMLFNANGSIAGSIFIFCWLIGWTAGGLLAILIFLWQLAGIERITVQEGILKLEKRIFNFSASKSYDINFITNFDFQEQTKTFLGTPQRGLDFTGLTGGTLKFDYGMKTVRFGSELAEAEARHLLSHFQANPDFQEGNFA